MRKLIVSTVSALALLAAGGLASAKPADASPLVPAGIAGAGIPIFYATAAAFALGFGCAVYDVATGRNDCGFGPNWGPVHRDASAYPSTIVTPEPGAGYKRPQAALDRDAEYVAAYEATQHPRSTVAAAK